MINPYSYPPFLAAILNGILIIWAMSQAPRGITRRTFIAWNICLALWNTGIAVAYCLNDAAAAYAWYKIISSLVIACISPFFLHFVIAVTETSDLPRNRWALGCAYASILFFTVIGLFTNLLMKDVHHYYWGYYPVAGRGEWMFGLTLYLLAGYAFWLLGHEMRRSEGHRRQQMKYLLAGAAFVFGCGFSNFLPLHGINIYPMGNLMNSMYSLVVAYAILEYGLMDIRMALRRGTVYTLLSGGLTIVYLSLVAVLQRLLGHYGIQENYVFYTAAFPITVILAPTMKTRIEPWVDQALFREHLVAAESSAANKDLSSMGILATEMAHEITKPLTRILNEQTRLEGTLKGKSQESLRKIEKETRRAAEIIDGFVMLSPHIPLHRTPSILSHLLEETLTTLGIEEDSSISVKRRLNQTLRIDVNPGQIFQILTNIIQNSWQAMPDGGHLFLSIQESAPASGEHAAEIRIEDSGWGIPTELQEQVFEPFFTTRKAHGGRGIGLSISRAMVKRHGGIIQIKSPVQNNRGTCITIRLPMDPKEILHETS